MAGKEAGRMAWRSFRLRSKLVAIRAMTDAEYIEYLRYLGLPGLGRRPSKLEIS